MLYKPGHNVGTDRRLPFRPRFAGGHSATRSLVPLVVATAFLAFGAWLAAGAVAAMAIGVRGIYVSLSPRLLKEWERGVLLRLGRFQRVLGPGINWTFPGFDRVSTVDMRIRSTPFQAEKTLTKDTVPVNVDAVLLWVVTDARKAIVEVEHYAATVSWAAQTTLRDVIGHTELVGLISNREQVDRQLQEIIDAKTSDWGITSTSCASSRAVSPDSRDSTISSLVRLTMR